MAQITYEEWFVRMKFPGHETAVFDEETGLPVGWELVKLGNEVDISSSKRIFLSEYVPNGIPFYRGKEISLKSSNNTLSDILYISEKRYNEIKSKFGGPKKDDILITAVGTIGSSYLVTESDGDFYFKDGNLIWLKGNNNISSRFLIAIFKNEQFRSLLNNIAIGSSQKAITIKSLKAITILKPNKIVLDQFDILMVNTLSQIENLHNQNQRLKEARDILLPRLMTGMIDVDRVEVES
jgi:type I restriction enzyme S subunit